MTLAFSKHVDTRIRSIKQGSTNPYTRRFYNFYKMSNYLSSSQDIIDYVKETKVKSVVLIILFMSILLLLSPHDKPTRPAMMRNVVVNESGGEW